MKKLLSANSRCAGAQGTWCEGLEARTFFCADLSAPVSAAPASLKPAVAIHHSTKTVKLFPDYIGTYSGTVVIKKGLDKGLVFTQTVTNTSENQVTGVLTFVGTNYFSNGTTISFAGTTTLKRSGAYTAVATDVPADTAGPTKDVGKFVGNISKGTYKNALNSGTFDDTLVA